MLLVATDRPTDHINKQVTFKIHWNISWAVSVRDRCRDDRETQERRRNERSKEGRKKLINKDSASLLIIITKFNDKRAKTQLGRTTVTTLHYFALRCEHLRIEQNLMQFMLFPLHITLGVNKWVSHIPVTMVTSDVKPRLPWFRVDCVSLDPRIHG